MKKAIQKLSVSICLPAYNEEKNISHVLSALSKQKTKHIIINKIIVVSSGSTDNTNKIVEKFAKTNKKILLVKEEKRNGKSAAINTFLRLVSDPVIIIESTDTIPFPTTIENLCKPFIKDAKIGMTGGAPIPVNDPYTFVGYIVHCWWWFHRNIPRFGEIIAFRNIIEKLPTDILVDEAYVQAYFVKEGSKVVHIDTAVVNNKGPDTIRELIKQRRKLFIGHAKLCRQEGVRISNMTKSSLKLLFLEFKIKNLKCLVWLLGGILVEIYARTLATYDIYVTKENPTIWDMATSTKDLAVTHRIGKSKVK